jgi:hypothetical protein
LVALIIDSFDLVTFSFSVRSECTVRFPSGFSNEDVYLAAQGLAMGGQKLEVGHWAREYRPRPAHAGLAFNPAFAVLAQI